MGQMLWLCGSLHLLRKYLKWFEHIFTICSLYLSWIWCVLVFVYSCLFGCVSLTFVVFKWHFNFQPMNQTPTPFPHTDSWHSKLKKLFSWLIFFIYIFVHKSVKSLLWQTCLWYSTKSWLTWLYKSYMSSKKHGDRVNLSSVLLHNIVVYSLNFDLLGIQ